MRITLDSLVVLDAVDRAGSFAAGAEQLFRVPSAVSYTIHKLEQDLGNAIFDRSRHRARLTEAGAQLLRDGRELLRLAEEVERNAREVGAGWEARLSIVLGDVVPRGAFYPLLSAFYRVQGHQQTHLQIAVEAQATCWETLLAGRSDLVIGAPEPSESMEGFGTQPLGEVELAFVVPPTHPLARAPEPLQAECVALHQVVRLATWPTADRPEHANHELVTVDGYDSQADAIRHGLGIGYLPAHLVRDDVAAGRLVMKTVANPLSLRLVVAWRSARAGHGLEWFLRRLRDRDVRAQLLSGIA
jgi:DNA-binding transcriptional LysR family regulator